MTELTRFDMALRAGVSHAGLLHLISALFCDAVDAIISLPKVERVFVCFWLLGPFVMLVERTPADLWLCILGLGFLGRAVTTKNWSWLKYFWVQACIVFCAWCCLTSSLSQFGLPSFLEALAWFRFPLFAMATVFWLSKDKRIFYAMLAMTAFGLFVMCCILFTEVLVEGQKGGRLTWPYGDLVPGSYVAKLGLPAFTIMVALAVRLNGSVGLVSSFFALVTILVSLITGERLNFLIRLCAGMLSALVWKPKLIRLASLIIVELLAMFFVFSMLPQTASRYVDSLVPGATDLATSPWLKTINGGWIIAKDNIWMGIGVDNYRTVSFSLLEGLDNAAPSNHPHNFYVQLLAETGVIGFMLGCVMILAILFVCGNSFFRNSSNVVCATSWIIPLSFFWPIATTSDFFGQWNNLFMWSALALAMGATNLTFRDFKNDSAFPLKSDQ